MILISWNPSIPLLLIFDLISTSTFLLLMSFFLDTDFILTLNTLLTIEWTVSYFVLPKVNGFPTYPAIKSNTMGYTWGESSIS